MFERGEITAALGDRYQISRILGRGSYGILYRGYDLQEGHEVAIKVIEGQDDPSRISFEDEARFLLGNRHDNIVRVYEYKIQPSEDGQLFILVMEYLPVTFGQVMATTALTVQQVCALVYQAADGLHDAWRRRHLLHCDVKPGNLMVTADGVVRVTDFGIAKEMPWAPCGTPLPSGSLAATAQPRTSTRWAWSCWRC